MAEQVSRQQHQVYEQIWASADFQELRKRYRAFVLPWTIGFMVWYLLFVVCANWATGFMTTQVIGNINVAFIFGILQFVSTFLIAFLYSRHSEAKIDPIANRLEAEYRKEVDR